MKILLISKVFYPNISPRSNRTTQLALEFARLGHDVTVMIPELDHDFYQAYSHETGVKFIDLGALKLKSINSPKLFLRILSRLLLLLFEYPDIQIVWMLKKVLKKLNGFDLLISIAVPHPIHWGTALAIKKNKELTKVWVADCGDPYMGCKTDTFEKLFYFKFIEKYWSKVCNYITIPEQSAKSAYYEEFHSKIKIIPQGFNFDEVQIPNYIKNSVPTFAYAGVLALHYRNPIPFLEFLCTLDFDFKFIIFTQSHIPRPYVERLNAKLEVHDYIARKDLLILMAKMDFVVNFENYTTVQVPSKLIDYSIVSRPVLSIAKDLDTNSVLEFLNGDYSNRYTLPNLKKYDIKNVAQQFLALL